ELEARAPQPGDGQILELMADRKDPQRATAKAGARILRRLHELKLQRAFARMPQPRAAEVVARRRYRMVSLEYGVDPLIDGFSGCRPVIKIQHQRRPSCSAMACMAC